MIRSLPLNSSDKLCTLIATVGAFLCVLGAAPPAASADITAKMMELCGHGQSLAGFTVEQYQNALKHLTTEEIEYPTECIEEIQRAELAAASHKGRNGSKGASDISGGLSGGSPSGGQRVEPSPAQERILAATRKRGAPAMRLGDGPGGSTSPGVVHPDLAAAASHLPAAVIAVIAAVIGGILLLVGHEIRERTRRSQLG